MTGFRIPALALLLLPFLATACGVSGTGPTDGPVPPDTERPYVVMVSFDGMGYDYIDRVDAPNFRRVEAAGVRANGLIPGYPSKTFPNHYGIATGLYPAHHGLVDNTFYDPEFDATYRIGDRSAVEDPRWYWGEPIWVTAETQGVRAASYFWVGTEAPIQGVQPTYFKYYDHEFPYAARVDTILHWLSLPEEERPQLVLLYFDQPDGAGHWTGPESADVDAAVLEADAELGRLLDGLERLAIRDQITVVLVSDHGMETVPEERVVYLDDYVDTTGMHAVLNSTQALLYFDGDTARVQAVYDALSAADAPITAYRRGETPDRWNYTSSRRIGELIVAADPGWIVRMRDWRPWSGGGMHGYDPYHRPMWGIFLAMGPGIAPGQRIPAFENVHIYPWLAHLLELEPADSIDGSLDVLSPVLLPDGSR